jgi:hypothetical protein
MGSLNNCVNCGCIDEFLTTTPAAVACPTQECSNIQFAQCVAYVGGNLLCGENIVVPTDTNLNEALSNIIDYFCTAIANISTTSVSAGSNVSVVSTIVGVNTDYEISADSVTVVAGTGVTVTSVVVGTNTEYTITSLSSTPGLSKYAVEFLNVQPADVLTITGANLGFCNIPNLPCNVDGIPHVTDFTYNLYWQLPEVTGWIGFQSQNYTLTVFEGTGNVAVTFSSIATGASVRIVIVG